MTQIHTRAEDAVSVVMQLGHARTVQKIEIETATREFDFYLAGEGVEPELEGKLFQEGGGLMLPVKDSSVKCQKLFSDATTTFWKVSVSIPEQKRPVSFGVVLHETISGKTFTKGLIRLQLADPVPGEDNQKSKKGVGSGKADSFKKQTEE